MDRNESSSVANTYTKLVDKKIECAAGLDKDNRDCFNEQRSNYSMEEIEEVFDTIEDERKNINHILEIKELLANSENQSVTEITLGLQMLALIVDSLEDLMVTDIATTVKGLLQHRSKRVIREAMLVVKKFKRIIVHQVDENAVLSSARTRGKDPVTNLDEHVLFNPPIDEGFRIGNIPDLDFTKFFEDIDDDGNPIIHKKTTIKKQKKILINKLTSPKNHTTPHKKNEIKLDSLQIPTKKRQNHVRRERKSNNRPSDTQFSLQRFAKQRLRQQNERNNDRKITMKDDEHKVHRISNVVAPRLHSRETPDDAAKMEEKLENSKRKLHEGYQAHERGRRSTKFIEGHECVFPKVRRNRRKYS